MCDVFLWKSLFFEQGLFDKNVQVTIFKQGLFGENAKFPIFRL